MVGLLGSGLARIEGLLSDPAIRHPEYAKNYYYDYKRLAELMDDMEEGAVLALERYGHRDRLVTKTTHQICKEIGYPYRPPLCSAISTQYYWALMRLDLIFAPFSEPFHLLGLSDLCHELAHFILLRQERRLIRPFLRTIKQYFDQAVREAQQKGWSKSSAKALGEYRRSWNKSWLLEFASDMVAAYCAGPAYGWSNVRLCTNLSADIFENASSHPADHARTVAIGVMLDRIGCQKHSAAIDAKWQELLATSGHVQPQEFELAYPRGLLKELATFLADQCTQIGLVMYRDDPPPNEPNVIKLLNDAWGEFFREPENFSQWERKQVEGLHAALGL
jgi:hypothetical protein